MQSAPRSAERVTGRYSLMVTRKPVSYTHLNAILNGIVKIASKMGISTIQSYQSSQIFEAVGLSLIHI